MHGSQIKGWPIPREWEGETAYVVGGGPSLRGVDLECLRGRKTIVVNSSYVKVPFADFLFFGDQRWWLEHDVKPQMRDFRGRIVTCSTSVANERVLKVNRLIPPPGLAEERDRVASQRTSAQGAMNLAFHLGVKRIVLVGLDMGRATDGVAHHHPPHPWPPRKGNVVWDEQMDQLQHIVGPLKRHEVEVINTSLASRIEWWPKMTLQAALESDNVRWKHTR